MSTILTSAGLLTSGLAAGWLFGRLPLLLRLRKSASQLRPMIAELSASPNPERVDTWCEQISEQVSGVPELEDVFAAQSDLIKNLFSVVKTLNLQVGLLNERYDLLTSNIAASIVIYDDRGEVIFCSPYTEFMTGYDAEEFYKYNGDLLEKITVEEDLDRYQRAKKISALAEDTIVRYQIRHQKGFRMWLETRMVPLCNESGEVDTVLAVSNDITKLLNDQKQIEEQSRDLQDFTYMVSHDLKAPIFTIKGMSNALVEDFGEALGDAGQEFVSYILEGIDRLELLIASVLEYTALSTKQTTSDIPIRLNEVVQGVLRDQAELARQTEAKIHVDSDLPVVKGDSVRLYQVFSNLIGNAMKYRSPERAPEIYVSVAAKNVDSVLIEIRDNGLGIPEAKLDAVFRPFQRAHGKEIEGSGIGLACVKKIMDKLGGEVSVESTEGQGSRFHLLFPLGPSKPQAVPDDLARCFQGGVSDTVSQA